MPLYSPAAPIGATYITQTANGQLSAEQNLAALATGLLKNTTGTGVLSIAAEGADYFIPPFLDTNALVKGSADPTKLLRWEIDGFTAGATRVMTPPNQDTTLAGQNFANVFTVAQTIQGPTATQIPLTLKTTDDNTTNRLLSILDSADVVMGYLSATGQFNVTRGTATSNTFLGNSAGNKTATGTNNVFIGNTVGVTLSSGINNFGLGSQALQMLTSGSGNVAIGTFALNLLDTATDNVAIGASALQSVTLGSNVAIGSSAGNSATSATNNVLIGAAVGPSLTQGDANVIIGQGAGVNQDTTSNNVIIGKTAGLSANTWTGSIVIGRDGRATKSNQTIFGSTGTPINEITHVSQTALTNAINNSLILTHNTSGTPAAGLGTGLLFVGESSTTVDTSLGRLTYEWVVATHASRTTRSKWTVFDTAEREAIRIEASGSAAMLAFLGAVAVVRPATYTLAGVATRTMPTPEATFTGQDNAQAGAVYAKSADLITLQTRLDSVEGVLRQLIIDLASTSGYGLLVAS